MGGGGVMLDLPQNKQGDETEACRHQEDETGEPGDRGRIGAVEDRH